VTPHESAARDGDPWSLNIAHDPRAVLEANRLLAAHVAFHRAPNDDSTPGYVGRNESLRLDRDISFDRDITLDPAVDLQIDGA
jgi:hypothetical protein